MAVPSGIEFNVGRDLYGRRTKLVGALRSDKTYDWSIVSEPVNQRDEGERIVSLSSTQLVELGRIADAFAKARQ